MTQLRFMARIKPAGPLSRWCLCSVTVSCFWA